MTDKSSSAGVIEIMTKPSRVRSLSPMLNAFTSRRGLQRMIAPLASTIALLGLAAPSMVGASEISDRLVADGYLRGKIQYCTYCHGSSGQGYRGYYSMPRLAGQTPEYFVNQMRAYAARQRKNKYMYSAAHGLSPTTLSALARHFAGLHPGANGLGSRGLSDEGRQIYQEGLPNSNIPACAACRIDASSSSASSTNDLHLISFCE